MHHGRDIRELLARVRGRWRALRVFRAAARAALAAAGAVGLGLVALRVSAGAPAAFAALAAASALLGLAGVIWGLRPLGASPSDARVARFIEERVPALEDRLVTAVDVVRASASASPAPSALVEPMLADAARRSRDVDLDAVLPIGVVRRAGLQAAMAACALGALVWVARTPARQAYDAALLTLFPQRMVLDVAPGHATVRAGAVLTIRAHLAGNRAPVKARMQIADGDRWNTAEMTVDAGGEFAIALPPASASFQYRVAAGPVSSPTYRIAVANPPRVTRIDLAYTYPPGLGLPPRTETDSGDIFAPAGTVVRVHVLTDRLVASGQLTLTGLAPIALSAASAPNEWSADVRVVDDTSYRVALADHDGFASAGDTEYFIRTLGDRPPEVRIVKPAADRQVTPLEEVEIEAQADDDYGMESLDLVYSVRGGAEKAVPLAIARGRTTVDGHRTLYLEDLDVHPGDFISYYARGRDRTRGTHPNEARSDIFFLDVRPYEQEFALAQSQGSARGSARGSIDDLVAAQKSVVVATWKLDRRAQSAKGVVPEQDIRSVSRAEAELKTRVEETASGFRESMMRDPRRRQPQRGRSSGASPGVGAGPALPEEDDMAAAAGAMGMAVAALDRVKTALALPSEMEALSRLLKAQAEVKRRVVQRPQSDGGMNRSNDDLSTLFDRELQQAQQTSYETPSTAGSREAATKSAIDAIDELAKRQDELLKRQRTLATERETMSAAARARELETLTREQAALRQRAEELSQRLAGRSSTGQQGQAGNGLGGGDASTRMKDVSEAMRHAASDLRRQDPGQASERAKSAVDTLRELQRRLESSSPDGRRPAAGGAAGAPGAGRGTQDGESRRLSAQLERARELRDALARSASELDALGAQPASAGRGGATGRSGAGSDSAGGARSQGAGRGADTTRLREELQRELKRTLDLVEELRREDRESATPAPGGPGQTFEGRGMTLGAPGTEGFKQDVAKWEELRRQATQALEHVESSLLKKLQATESRDRLAAGVGDQAPAGFETQVDSYFREIAGKTKP